MATIYEYSRMCKYYKYCDGCPLADTIKDDTCGAYITNFPDEATKIINDWIKEHPITTYASNLLAKFPNVAMNSKGYPDVCVSAIYGGKCPYDDKCAANSSVDYCEQCWNREYTK